MKLVLTKKILFIISGLLIVLVLAGVGLEHYRLKQKQTQSTALQANPPGTCAPDASCKGNPELCMADNLNKVCD